MVGLIKISSGDDLCFLFNIFVFQTFDFVVSSCRAFIT